MLKMRPIILLLFVISLAFSSCSQETVSTTDSFEGIELPDGSIVLLNHNSSIEYDKDFDPRKISLTGEAYFNVVASAVPFIVKTNFGEVKVLGTKFNVVSNDDEMEVKPYQLSDHSKFNFLSDSLTITELLIVGKF